MQIETLVQNFFSAIFSRSATCDAFAKFKLNNSKVQVKKKICIDKYVHTLFPNCGCAKFRKQIIKGNKKYAIGVEMNI